MKKVLILGAAGPVATACIRHIEDSYALRLADVRKFPTSHEFVKVDITDAEQVTAAATGVDVIINCTVQRQHPVDAFRVNVTGAYNTMQAAVAQGVKRVIHTGPYQNAGWSQRGDWWGHEITEVVPPHPGTNLYAITKCLSEEVCRRFAEEHGIQVITLLFGSLVWQAGSRWGSTFLIHWDDAGEAFRCALDVADLPSLYERFHICVDTPTRKYPPDRARALLHWEPEHKFEEVWLRRPTA